MLESAQQNSIPVENVETKAALVAVARYLDRLLMAITFEECQLLLKRCLAEISWRKYYPRPGRKFPRKSKSRHGKWANKWRYVNGIEVIFPRCHLPDYTKGLFPSSFFGC